ncbi:hypothetical protein ASPACDRAFT_1878882 [Aspergillus aculeatus ATCC 16872]|uniref:Zn(2)-C6 fungal-type domain-containing protein n=1 Tax=Aspergillus aculeatus (strain ATCC 16872 / CBS 172.66 / WB 5094) TaxID=690307 RepID=A0A1L9X727_ASPA1|nr:uncharacterized protein ASPACDRAFT_1878882 [Aspergillus aculeatus ATCC 16872]OJK04250.1 hypothetical protein ASPACDRAFT_1878882 [Aspergillus aculeatus ATCC 16872]
MATIQGSCHNCHARKVRCDRNTPRCSSCQMRGVDCQRPESPPRILWLRPRNAPHGEGEVEELHARRQPLFTEYQLACNAGDLVCVLGSVSIAAALNELDQQAVGSQSDETVSIGPFRAFRFMNDKPPIQPDGGSDTNAFGGLDPAMSEAMYGLPDDAISLSNIAAHMDTSSHAYSALNPPQFAFPLHIPFVRRTPQDLVDFTAPTAKLLLDHYRHTIINYLAPARVKSKSPWEKIYIPSMLGAIGEILLQGNSSNARVSLLFSVLAVSAYSLHENTLLEDEWGCYASPRLLGNTYRARATARLKRSLRDLSAGGTKKDKYKDILMALLSMVTICIVSGNMNYAAHYLRDIEEIIHRYGTRKVGRSVKVRMLHSIYLYTHNWVRDLEDSDPKFRSPFEDIYSLPQSLFELIAATTRLASSLGRSTMRDFSEPVHPSTLLASVRILEARICSWEYGTEDVDGASPRPPPERSPYHLVQAVHKALIIHFHRAIGTHRLNDQSADTCWPAFIAGCEALDPQLQGEFARWLHIAAQTTGIRMYTVALEAMRQVWEARRRPGKQDAAWSQVLFNSKNRRVLVLS